MKKHMSKLVAGLVVVALVAVVVGTVAWLCGVTSPALIAVATVSALTVGEKARK